MPGTGSKPLKALFAGVVAGFPWLGPFPAAAQVPSRVPGIIVPFGLTDVSGTLFFAANDGVHGVELWKSDGTAAGTAMAKDIVPGPGRAPPFCLTPFGSARYFRADDGVHGDELWKADGTETRTTLVKDINPGSASAAPFSLTPWNGMRCTSCWT